MAKDSMEEKKVFNVVDEDVVQEAVTIAVESLGGVDTVTCEALLETLDILLATKKGREAAYSHALTVPAIVKKMLRVSAFASEVSVSILWKLCRHSSDGRVMTEAMQAGAFHKMVALLQIGCSPVTKTKATQLLKLFHHYHSFINSPMSDLRYVRPSLS